jgi:hypothetical protein
MQDNSGQAGKKGLEALEQGQVLELKVRGTGISYWTYLRSVSPAVTAWLPELNRVPVELPPGTELDLSVTLSGSELLLVSARAGTTAQDGRKSYCELLLDRAAAAVSHQRRFLRVTAMVPVALRRLPDGVTPWGEQVAARTTTLSQGGLSLETAGDFKPGEQLAVELELTASRAQATAVVLSADRLPGGGLRLALRFTHISDKSEAEITKLIYQYQRTHGAARDE